MTTKATTKAQIQTDMNSIAVLAFEVRGHLVMAIRNLDEIIALAKVNGQPDIVAAANKAMVSALEAKVTFNDGVTESGGSSSKIDPIVLDAVDKAAVKADADYLQLLAELKKRVDTLSKNVMTWGFDSEDGNTKPTPGTWADWSTRTVSAHQITLHGPDGESGLVKDVAEVANKADAAKAAADKATADVADAKEAANAAATKAEEAKTAANQAAADAKEAKAVAEASNDFNALWAVITFVVIWIIAMMIGWGIIGGFAACLLGLGLGAAAGVVTGVVVAKFTKK